MPKYVLTDAEVKLTGYLSEKKYPESFRLIRYYDEEGDREFTFLTNATHISALDVANLYKKRWLVELFFKWLKQHLKIKKILGHNGKCCPHSNQCSNHHLLSSGYCPTRYAIEALNL